MIKVYYTNEQDIIEVNIGLRNLVKRAITGALKYEKFNSDAEVSVVFTDNAQIRELNKEYRNKDSATDVLSFPMYDFRNGEEPVGEEPVELGDIVLSLERAKEQAEAYGHSLKREITFLTVHSVLHLLGYDHEISDEEEKLMFNKQDEIMELLNISRETI